MSVKVTVKLDNAKITQLEKIQKQALEMTAEAVLSDIKTSAVTPKQTGELERSGFVDVSKLNNLIAAIILILHMLGAYIFTRNTTFVLIKMLMHKAYGCRVILMEIRKTLLKEPI